MILIDILSLKGVAGIRHRVIEYFGCNIAVCTSHEVLEFHVLGRGRWRCIRCSFDRPGSPFSLTASRTVPHFAQCCYQVVVSKSMKTLRNFDRQNHP